MLFSPTADEQVSRTQRLIVLCARTSMTESERSEATEIIAHGVDTAALLDIALHHKVLQLIAPHILRLDTGGRLSFQARFLMKMYYEATKRRNTVLLAEAARVLRGFGEDGITAIPLKGLVLAPEVYGDLGLRAMNDLDFLIPTAERRSASAALQRMGYVVGDYQIAGDTVELASAETELSWRMHIGNLHPHVRMLDDPFAVCARVDLSYDVDTQKNYHLSNALLAASEEGEHLGESTSLLTAVDFGIHVAIHMYKEATNEHWLAAARGAGTHLIKVCDLREYLLAQIQVTDHEVFCRRVLEIGAASAVGHGLDLVASVYDDPPIRELADRLHSIELR